MRLGALSKRTTGVGAPTTPTQDRVKKYYPHLLFLGLRISYVLSDNNKKVSDNNPIEDEVQQLAE